MEKKNHVPEKNPGCTLHKKDRQTARKMNPLEVMKCAEKAVNEIINIIDAVSTGRQKAKALDLEQARIHADMERHISDTENETRRMLAEYDLELKKIDQEIKDADNAARDSLCRHEENMQAAQNQHDFEMRRLDILEKVIDAAISQQDRYMSQMVCFSAENGPPVLDFQMISAMGTQISILSQQLSALNYNLSQTRQTELEG